MYTHDFSCYFFVQPGVKPAEKRDVATQTDIPFEENINCTCSLDAMQKKWKKHILDRYESEKNDEKTQ